MQEMNLQLANKIEIVLAWGFAARTCRLGRNVQDLIKGSTKMGPAGH